ncbi:MAG: tRNA-dependent cyclodipeptide synthase [Cyanobacteria bacterium J06635_10]
MDEETIIENIDWNQLSLERLKLVQSKICKAIDIKKHELSISKSTAKISQINEYKASLAKVSPSHLRNSLSKYQKCVFPISLGTKKFADTKRIQACIKWISENFQSCLVLVADSVYRLTIEVRQGIKGDRAKLLAIRTGEEFVNKNNFLFDKYSQSCEFEFKMASQIEKESEFEVYYQELQCLYQKDESFQNMVKCFGDKYLHRGKQFEEENKEKAAVARAAQILGVERSVVASLESLVEIEESADRLRLAIFETDV